MYVGYIFKFIFSCKGAAQRLQLSWLILSISYMLQNDLLGVKQAREKFLSLTLVDLKLLLVEVECRNFHLYQNKNSPYCKSTIDIGVV